MANLPQSVKFLIIAVPITLTLIVLTLIILQAEIGEGQTTAELASALEVYEGNGTLKVLSLDGLYSVNDWLGLEQALTSEYNLIKIVQFDERIFAILQNGSLS